MLHTYRGRPQQFSENGAFWAKRKWYSRCCSQVVRFGAYVMRTRSRIMAQPPPCAVGAKKHPLLSCCTRPTTPGPRASEQFCRREQQEEQSGQAAKNLPCVKAFAIGLGNIHEDELCVIRLNSSAPTQTIRLPGPFFLFENDVVVVQRLDDDVYRSIGF